MRTEQQTLETLEQRRAILHSLAESLLSPAFRGHIDASDLVQQTLLEACSEIDKLKRLDQNQIAAWLRTALKHNLLDAIKHLKTAKNDIAKAVREEDIQGSFLRLEQLLAAQDTSPSQSFERKENIESLLGAMQSLPDNQRLAIMLKHLRGYTLKEVSETLGLSESAVAGLLHRGRLQLIACLGKAFDE